MSNWKSIVSKSHQQKITQIPSSSSNKTQPGHSEHKMASPFTTRNVTMIKKKWKHWLWLWKKKEETVKQKDRRLKVRSKLCQIKKIALIYKYSTYQTRPPVPAQKNNESYWHKRKYVKVLYIFFFQYLLLI